MFPARLAGSMPALLFAAAALVAAAGCSAEGPESPEDLFEQTMTALREGRHDDVFEFHTLAYQRQWASDQEAKRVTLIRNPGARARFVADFHTTWEEYVRMNTRELWRAHHVQGEPLGTGSKIVERSTDPVNGADVLLTWESRFGQRFRWVTTWEAGRGWRIRGASPVKVAGR